MFLCLHKNIWVLLFFLYLKNVTEDNGYMCLLCSKTFNICLVERILILSPRCAYQDFWSPWSLPQPHLSLAFLRTAVTRKSANSSLYPFKSVYVVRKPFTTTFSFWQFMNVREINHTVIEKGGGIHAICQRLSHTHQTLSLGAGGKNDHTLSPSKCNVPLVHSFSR